MHRAVTWIWVLFIGAITIASCKSEQRTAKKPTQRTQNPEMYTSSGGYSDSCTTTSCPEIGYRVSVNGAGDAFLQATIGQSVMWSFSAAPDYGSRQFTVYNATSIPKPQNMQISGQYTGQVRIQWTPTTNDPQSGSLQVSVRDMTRCQMLNQSQNAAGQGSCNNFSVTTQADSMRTLNWQIRTNTGQSQFGNPNNGSSGNRWMAVLPAIFGVLSGNQTLGEALPAIGSAMFGGPATVGYGSTPITGYNQPGYSANPFNGNSNLYNSPTTNGYYNQYGGY